MTKHTIINGFTKQSMIEAVYSGNKGHKSNNRGAPTCRYLANDGNKCAVGCFIPKEKYDEVFDIIGDVEFIYERLYCHMPLNLEGLRELQSAHDNYPGSGDIRLRLVKFIKERCKE